MSTSYGTIFSILWYVLGDMSEAKKAKIIRSSKREFDCLLLDSKEIVKAVCLRELIKQNHLVVGDDVIVRPQDNDERFEIFELCERQNEVFRKIVRSNKKKVIASNIDVLLIVASVSKPDYKPFLIDRYITRSVQWGIPALVVFTKMDEFDGQFDLDLEKRKFDHLGINYFEISNEEESPYFQNISKLKELLTGKTAITLGQSGVGKSKLITRLSAGKIELLSSRLAKGVNKGAHTTTWAELIDLDDFYMIDSPGVRTLAVADIANDEIDELFPDLIPYFNLCKFNDCKHEENSKGCTFKNLNPEDETDQIILLRLISYLKMKEEVSAIPDWQR